MATRKKSAKSRTALRAAHRRACWKPCTRYGWRAWAPLPGLKPRGRNCSATSLRKVQSVHTTTRRATVKAVRGAFSEVQEGITSRVEQAREQAGDAFENLEKIFQTRVHRALNQLGVPSAEEIASLSKRVDTLNANIVQTHASSPASAHGA